jgi:hypothetical protein
VKEEGEEEVAKYTASYDMRKQKRKTQPRHIRMSPKQFEASTFYISAPLLSLTHDTTPRESREDLSRKIKGNDGLTARHERRGWPPQ